MALYDAVRPALFRLPPETAHTLGTYGLRAVQSSGFVRRAVRRQFQFEHPMLEVTAFGQTFSNPVGVAAGFDKNAEVTHALADLGFGFVEVGTVTPYPQPGNPRPRLFRLPDEEAVINRMGFNGQGAERVRERFETEGRPAVPVAVNVGKMNSSDADEAVEDYRRAFSRLYDHGDLFVVNVSCPNTPEAYDQGDPDHLRRTFSTLEAENDADKPVLVKVGPDDEREQLAALVDVVEAHDIDGIVATNTTTSREGVSSPKREEGGGLSGKPLESRATRVVRTLYELTDLPIVGVGGVDSAESAYRKIRAGATLVELYTGLIFQGPGLPGEVNRGLVKLLRRDGFDSVDEAVGADVD
jgi:dihydroorotate dehydrogenase